MDSFNNSSNQVGIIEEYKDYYQYNDSMKGLEIYAWQDTNTNDWKCILINGTNCFKTIDEIKKLQNELPCPISTMKEILKYYSD